MRTATFIIGLMLCGAMFLQSCLLYGTGTVLDTIRPVGEDAMAPTVVVGLAAAVVALAGMAFSLSKPRASIFMYLIAAVLAFRAHRDGFSDMELWGFAMIWLAGMCFWSWREVHQQRATP